MKRSEIRRKAWMPRGTKRVKARNPKRREKEFERAYHSRERVEWVKAQPCVVSDCELSRRDVENMHTKGDGAGRKGHYSTIVPACHGHHGIAHRHGIKTFAAIYDLDLEAAAAATEQAWREVA